MEENQIIFEDVKKASVHINKFGITHYLGGSTKMFKKLEKSFKKLNIIDNMKDILKDGLLLLTLKLV